MRIEENILHSDAFPSQLQVSRSRPHLLWFSGDLNLLKLPMVSVVGTRKVSKEGIARTQRVAKTLVSQGICIVSGLAEGVDAAAHITALKEHGATVAVMGTPIDECYPATNAQLKIEIEMHGLVLSQFEPGSEIQKGNFPRRNELMASLSMMTIVIEADINSGTRHQVKSAISLGRMVGFLPSLAESRFPWVEDALKSGRGFVINSPRDLIKQLEILRGKTEQSVAPIKEDQLTLAVEEPISEPVVIVAPLPQNSREADAVSIVTVSNEKPTPEKDATLEHFKPVIRRNWYAPIAKCWTWIVSRFKDWFWR
jgi:DNA processing protein